VFVVWVALAVANGLYFSFSVFLVPLIEEFRWSRGLTAGALSLSTIVQGLLAPVAGVLVDRFGPRRVILSGAVLLSSASLLAATIHSPWELYFYTGVLAAAGLVGLGPVPMGVLVSRWFVERRGRAIGLAFSGMGFGVFVTGPLAQWLIATYGWRTASATLGAGAFCILFPAAWLGALNPRPRREDRVLLPQTSGEGRGQGEGVRGDGPAPHPTLDAALRTRAFWALWLANLFTPLAVFPVTTHQVAFAIDSGFAPLLAASVFGITGLMSSLGRVVFGLAADRVGGALAATVSFGCTAGGALALLALESDPRVGWLIAYALLFGLGFGARGPIITVMASDLFGGRQFGVIYGALSIGNGLYGLFILPESLPRERRAVFTWRRANPVGSLVLLRSHPELTGLAFASFLAALAHASLPSIGVLYMMYRYGWDERIVGFTMAGVGLSAMIVQGGLIGPAVARFGERAALIVGLLFGAVAFTVWAFAQNGVIFWLGIPLLSLWGIASAASLGLMSRRVGPSEQGELQGANASLMGIANLFGPGLFTQAFALFIGPSVWHLPGAAYLMAALLLAAAAAVAASATRQR